MQTGARWSGRANPRDLTKTRQLELLRQKAEREQAADIDVAAIRAEIRKHVYAEAFDAGWNAATEFVIEKANEAGINETLVTAGILEDIEPGEDE